MNEPESSHETRVEDVFDQAARVPPEQRSALLDELCAGDALLRSEVEELLGCLSRATTQLDVSPVAEAFLLPESLGNYRIIRSIGRGGMGEVFEAEQANPRRLVALKVIRGGFATPRIVRRFEAEAAALAQLRHPGIAQIYESGFFAVSMPGGQPERRPYLAMELIKGVPLDVAARGLDLAAKVALMADVADAVQHAHQRGVIHRDLKPANILTETTERGTLRPRILDFGIARLTEQQSPGHATMLTEAGQMMGTLGFMSPEQVRSRPEELDTRADVYSLGVTAYLLLADKMPLDLGSKSAFDAAKAVIEEEPARLGAWVPGCKGDLETIVAKAMHKDRELRYASAAEFAADLRRYLANEPISARPPSTAYTITKFAQRHKALVGAGALVLLLLAGSSIALSVMYLQVRRDRTMALAAQAKAEAEARTLNATVGFLVEDTLGQANPSRKGLSLKVIDVLNDATGAVDERFADDALIRARVRCTLADLLVAIAQYDAARPLLAKALREFGAAGESDSEFAASVQTRLGIIESATGHPQIAEPLLRDALSRLHRSTGDVSAARLKAQAELAEALQVQGRHQEAQELLREIIAVLQPSDMFGWQTAVSARLSLAASLKAMNSPEDVEPLIHGAVNIARQHLPENSLATNAAMSAYVNYLASIGRNKEAAALALDLLERIAAHYPPDHPQLGFVAAIASHVLAADGQNAKAKELASRAFTTLRKTYDDADFTIERMAGTCVATFEGDGDIAGGVPYFKFWLQSRLLAAGTIETQGVIDRTTQFLLRLYKVENLQGPDRASRTMRRWADECRTSTPIIEKEGGPARSPHAARLLANLALSVHACSGEGNPNQSLVTELLAQARTAAEFSQRKTEDLALIDLVQSRVKGK